MYSNIIIMVCIIGKWVDIREEIALETVVNESGKLDEAVFNRPAFIMIVFLFWRDTPIRRRSIYLRRHTGCVSRRSDDFFFNLSYTLMRYTLIRQIFEMFSRYLFEQHAFNNIRSGLSSYRKKYKLVRQ